MHTTKYMDLVFGGNSMVRHITYALKKEKTETIVRVQKINFFFTYNGIVVEKNFLSHSFDARKSKYQTKGVSRSMKSFTIRH